MDLATPHIRIFRPLVDQYGLVGAAVYGAIWWHCQGEEGYCFASYSYIAKETGTSERTVRRWAKTLVKDGWIKELWRVAGSTTAYQLTDRVVAGPRPESPGVRPESPPTPATKADKYRVKRQLRAKRTRKRKNSKIESQTVEEKQAALREELSLDPDEWLVPGEGVVRIDPDTGERK